MVATKGDSPLSIHHLSHKIQGHRAVRPSVDVITEKYQTVAGIDADNLEQSAEGIPSAVDVSDREEAGNVGIGNRHGKIV